MTHERQFAGFDRKAIRAATRRRALIRVLLSMWAFLTVILLLCLVFLAFEMARQGQDPLASVKEASRGVPSPIAPSGPAATREVTLYFGSADGRGIAPETDRVEIGNSTVENCQKALEGLIHGPRETLTSVLPPTTKIRGMYLVENGELVVDFSMELESELKRVQSASVEGLMAYAVVNTLTQPALRAGDSAVSSVRFLIEGAQPRDTFPAHMDMTKPIFPDPGWVVGTRE